jgi:hypothetical protein
MATRQGSGFGGCRPSPAGRYTTIFLVCEVSKIDEIGLHKFGYVIWICCFATAICHQNLVPKYAVSARCQTF